MNLSGKQKIAASREKVFRALFDPRVLKESIPSCQSAETINSPEGNQLKLTITTGVPGFQGPYTVFIHASEVVAPSHAVLTTEPVSSVGSVKAVCTVDLSDNSGTTDLNYSANAQLSGKIGAVPDLVMKPVIKNTLDKFFSNFEQQVSSN